MKKFSKIILAVLMVVATSISLIACNSNTNTNNQNSTTDLSTITVKVTSVENKNISAVKGTYNLQNIMPGGGNRPNGAEDGVNENKESKVIDPSAEAPSGSEKTEDGSDKGGIAFESTDETVSFIIGDNCVITNMMGFATIADVKVGSIMQVKLNGNSAYAIMLYSFNDFGNGGEQTSGNVESSNIVEVPTVADPSNDFNFEKENLFDDKDYNATYNEDESIEINLEDNTANCENEKVEINGSIITIKDAGTYIVKGTLNGQIIVDAEAKDVQIVLDGATITNTESAVLVVSSANNVNVTLVGTNTLSTTGEFVNKDIDNIGSAIYANSNIVVNGTGTLNINCAEGNGLESSETIKVVSGNINVVSKKHSIKAVDSVVVANGILNLNSGKDGIHCENEEDADMGYVFIDNIDLTINADCDGIDASGNIQINNGNYTIVCGGGYVNATDDENADSMKGIKTDASILINDGTFNLNCADDAINTDNSVQINSGIFEIKSGDDGIHSDKINMIKGGELNIAESVEAIEGESIVISGGNISINASDDGINASVPDSDDDTQVSTDNCYLLISSGSIYVKAEGDGIDSNGCFYVTGGNIIVEGPANSDNSALDYDINAQITGGNIIGVGSSQMAQNFNGASQGSILVNYSENFEAGTVIELQDDKGNVIFSQTTKSAFNSVVVSTSNIEKDKTYTLKVGDNSQEIEMTTSIYNGGNGGMRRR